MKSDSDYEVVIGMEVHIELETKSKMFCACPADHFGKAVNSQTCPICLGLPGALPVPNGEAIGRVQLIGEALGCNLSGFSKFDRKNYFYPDLPKGYQISQYDLPLCVAGRLEFVTGSGAKKTVGIRRVHLEEDTAKMVHEEGASLVDFNRSGVPLAEIVSEPDMRSSEEVKEYLKALVKRIKHLGVSSCDMEKGTLRLEANISVRKAGTEELPGYKVEVKNVNSFRFIASAIDFEKVRQMEIIDKGGSPIQETRGFDENRGVTVGQREKEEAKDYRYFPEPDIPPFRFAESYLLKVKQGMGELPEEAAERLKKLYKLSDGYIAVLTESPERLRMFNRMVEIGQKQGVGATKIANAIVNRRVDLSLAEEEIVSKLANVRPSVDEGQDFSSEVQAVLIENPGPVADYKKGKNGVIDFLVGQIMKRLKGKADPVSVRSALESKLKES